MHLLIAIIVLIGCDQQPDVQPHPPSSRVPVAIEDYPLLSLGVVEGDSAQQFFGIASPFLLEDNRLVVPVVGTNQIRIFNLEGRLLQTLGGGGRGPGEFERLSQAWARGDTVEAYDASLRRITRFLPDGTVQVVPTEADARFRGAARGAITGGWLLTAIVGSGADRRDEVGVQLFDRAGSPVAEIARIPGIVRDIASGAREPLSPRAIVRIGRDEIYIAETLTPQVDVFDGSGNPVGRISWTPQRQLSPTDAFRSMVAAVAARDGSAASAAVRRLVEAGNIPEQVSVFWDMVVDEEGYIWIRTYDPTRHSTPMGGGGGGSYVHGPAGHGGEWLILSRNGAQTGSIALPERFSPVQISSDVIVGVSRGAFDVELVQVYRLQRK